MVSDNVHTASSLPRVEIVTALDETQYAPYPDENQFLKTQTSIYDDAALKSHVLSIQEEAYGIHPYPCIRKFAFIRLKIARFPVYEYLLQLGMECPGAIFLDVGCCFGNDVRKAVADGYPISNIIATDLNADFWMLGHKLFKSTPETFPVPFLAGNVLDPNHLEPCEPFTATPTTPMPILASLTSLNPLRGHVSAIHASALFHLFDEAAQLNLARALAGLLSCERGSLIFGSHGGRSKKGLRDDKPDSRGNLMFCHSPESWSRLWDGEVFAQGTVRVVARLVEESQGSREIGPFPLLEWSITRL